MPWFANVAVKLEIYFKTASELFFNRFFLWGICTVMYMRQKRKGEYLAGLLPFLCHF